MMRQRIGEATIIAVLVLLGHVWLNWNNEPPITAVSQHMQPTNGRFPYEPQITAAAQRHGLDPLLLAALVKQESGFNPDVCSHAGACGLGQLMPLTAAELGVVNRFNPEQNLDGAARYLSQQLQRFGRLDLALAAYNAGPGRVGRCRCIPEGEASRYVPAVLSHYQDYK